MSPPIRSSMNKNSWKAMAPRHKEASVTPMKPSNNTPATTGGSAGQKPRAAFALATALGTGYLKPAPGTWGSLVGLLVAVVSHPFTWFSVLAVHLGGGFGLDLPLGTGALGIAVILVPSIAVWLFLALLGVRTSRQVAE